MNRYTCRKQVTYGHGAYRISDDECRRRAKLWIFAGHADADIENDENPRSAHIAIDARDLDDSKDETVLDFEISEL